MSRVRKAKLIGAIRLVEVDTIGVPVLVDSTGNRMFVPEMDGDLRISKYLAFFNEEGFQIEYNVPKIAQISVGDSAPIVFWIEGKCHIIIGDADKEEPFKLFGRRARQHGVLRDISRLLDDARSGRIAERYRGWEAESIANAFSDVFYEPPVRSRYWVSRYRASVREARRKTTPPHPIDVILRQTALDWFKRFGTKTDLRKLVGMLGSPSNQILSKRQVHDILFAFLVNRLDDRSQSDVDIYLSELTLQNVFPEGLYGYFISHGWPRVPFQYKKSDFVVRAMDEIHVAQERDDFRRCRSLLFVLFGKAELPTQINEWMTNLWYRSKQFIRDSNKQFDNALSYNKSMIAEDIVDECKRFAEIDSILNGSNRLSPKFDEIRGGITNERIKKLKLFASKTSGWE